MNFYFNDLGVAVNEEQIKSKDIDGIFDTLLEEYDLENISPEEISERIYAEEYADLFSQRAEDFLDVYEIGVIGSKGKTLGMLNITDFNISEMNFYIPDLYKSAADISDEYGDLFSHLYKIGYDYNADYYILPEMLYLSDISFITKDDDERYLMMRALLTYLRRKRCKECAKDRFLFVCFIPENDNSEERFILRANGFRAIPDTDMLVADFQL